MGGRLLSFSPLSLSLSPLRLCQIVKFIPDDEALFLISIQHAMREHERSFYVFLPRILKGTLLNLLKRLRYCHAFIAQPRPKVAELTSLNFGVVTPPPLSVASRCRTPSQICCSAAPGPAPSLGTAPTCPQHEAALASSPHT